MSLALSPAPKPTQKTAGHFAKRAWVRNPLAPVGSPALGQINCPCHNAPLTNYTPGPWAYGWEVRYDDARFIELRDAEKMVKTLRFAKNGLEKLNAQFGHPQTFDEYVVRVAAVFRCPGFLVENTHEVQDYTGEQYHLFPLADLRWHVREALNHVHETLKN